MPDGKVDEPRRSNGYGEGLAATLRSAIRFCALQAENASKTSEETLRFAQAAHLLAQTLAVVERW